MARATSASGLIAIIFDGASMPVPNQRLAEAIALFAKGIGESNRPEDRILAERYLAALAPLLAAAVLGEDISDHVREIERLFGNTWLVDDTPFQLAFQRWREFRAVARSES
jgi:hypothetical protein